MDPQRPKRISDLFKNIAKKCGNIQKKFSEKAQEYGYSKDIFEKTGYKFQNLPDHPILDDVAETLQNHFQIIQEQEKDIFDFLDRTGPSYIAYSTATTASATAATFYTNYPLEALASPPSWTINRHKEYAKKLAKLDKELGKTFESVWEAFHGATKSPEKQALYSMRQTFDHFFRVIAPDDEVRKSPFFKEKVGEKEPQKVYRKEKLEYAANIKIKNKKVAQLLISQSRQILKTYDELNKLHTETALNRDAVREILNAMQSILEEWIDALEI